MYSGNERGEPGAMKQSPVSKWRQLRGSGCGQFQPAFRRGDFPARPLLVRSGDGRGGAGSSGLSIGSDPPAGIHGRASGRGSASAVGAATTSNLAGAVPGMRDAGRGHYSMMRRLLNLLTVLSLLMCVAVCVLWVRSYAGSIGADDHVSEYLTTFKGRHTVRAERGRLTLYAPPAVPPLSTLRRPRRHNGATGKALVPTLRNDQVKWEVILWPGERTESFLSPRVAAEPGKTLVFGYPTSPGRALPPVVSQGRVGPAAVARTGAFGPVRGRPRRRVTPRLSPGRAQDAGAPRGRDASRRRGRPAGDPHAGGPPKPLRSVADDPSEFEWPAGVTRFNEVVLYSCSARC